MNKFLQRLRIFLITVLCLSLSLLFVACGEPGEKGDKGDKGDTGATGVSIVSIAKDSTSGNVDIYKITLSNGNTSTFTVTNGTNGSDGQNGQNGADGISVTNAQIVDGELILSFSQGNQINLGKVVGEDGQDGQDGADGEDGQDGVGIKGIVLSNEGELTITLTDDTPINLGNVKGNDGKSAYQMYKEKNPSYTGDEDQWMSDLVNGKLSTVQVTKYTVTFDSNGGTPVDPQQVEKCEKAIQPDNPTREGYTFLGWYTGKYGDEKWVFSGYPVTEAITLTAKWQINSYNLTFDSNGGTVVENDTVVYNTNYTLPQPTKDNFVFAGWQIENVLYENETIVVKSDMSFVAKWVDILEYYTVEENVDGVVLTKYIGGGTKVRIPTTFNGKSIIAIGDRTFEDNATITSVVVPSNITSIGNYAFFNCSSLVNISIPSSIASIGDYAFYDCSSLININIPSNITSIGSYAFEYCNNLSYNISNGIRYIGNNQNKYVVAMSVIDKSAVEVSIKDDCKFIYEKAFYGCSSLTDITIPNSVTSIGVLAFGYCKKLETVKFEESSKLASIKDGAFSNCSSLANISIPDGVISIGSIAFDMCNNLIYNVSNGIKYLGNNQNKYVVAISVVDKSATGFSIKDGCKIIHAEAFYDCKNLKSILIPDSVISIGRVGFGGCNKLEAIVFGENSKLTRIAPYAFTQCTSLVDISIPDSVISIEEGAFNYCRKLERVTFGANSKLTNIGNNAFMESKSLTSIIIPATVTFMGTRIFGGCSSLIIYCEEASQPANWDIDWYADWNNVKRPVYWYSETQPTTSGNWWHYVDGVVTKWSGAIDEGC